MPRQIKDEYEIIAEIGVGGMAVVYKAVQKSLGRTVAVKELKKAYHADAQIVRRFERESRVAASLQHENIVHIYDYWKKPVFAIVMEHVDGANLADVIEKTGALPVDVGIMIAVQVCHALDYAHMRGLIHRDIKPSNIMIKRNGEVKLMDFGIAQSRNLEALTVPGTLIGTPAYMSPEQVLGQQLDVRSDIFSFGIVLYEMFTGIKPFEDAETRSVTSRILEDKFLAPRRVNRDIPRGLQRAIKKCLRKKPQRRFGSMQEIEHKLGKRLAGRTTKSASLVRIADYLVSQEVFAAVPEQETMVITARPPKWGRLRKALIPAALLALLAAGGSVYYYHYRAMEVRKTLPPPAALPAPPAGGAPLISRPQETAKSAPTSPAPAGQVTDSPGLVSQPSQSPPPAGKKPNPAKKKKRKTSPLH